MLHNLRHMISSLLHHKIIKFCDLPPEVLLKVLSYLDIVDIFRLHFVSSKVHKFLIEEATNLPQFHHIRFRLHLGVRAWIILDELRPQSQVYLSSTFIDDEETRKLSIAGLVLNFWSTRSRKGNPVVHIRPDHSIKEEEYEKPIRVLLKLLFFHFQPTRLRGCFDGNHLLYIADLLPTTLTFIGFEPDRFCGFRESNPPFLEKEEDFLTALEQLNRVKTLRLLGCQISCDFYYNVAIHQLEEFVLDTEREDLVNTLGDEELLKQHWRRAQFKHACVTDKGLNRFLHEWADGGREVERLRIEYFVPPENRMTLDELLKELPIVVIHQERQHSRKTLALSRIDKKVLLADCYFEMYTNLIYGIELTLFHEDAKVIQSRKNSLKRNILVHVPHGCQYFFD